MSKDQNKIDIPDIVIDPKNPDKRFKKGKFLGRVSYSVCVSHLQILPFIEDALNISLSHPNRAASSNATN